MLESLREPRNMMVDGLGIFLIVKSFKKKRDGKSGRKKATTEVNN